MAVALESGELFCADSRRESVKISADKERFTRTSMPLFFHVRIAGKHWYDGGLRDQPFGGSNEENPTNCGHYHLPLGPNIGDYTLLNRRRAQCYFTDG